MNNRLIILDRDGVINFDSPSYIKNPRSGTQYPEVLKPLHE